MRPAGMSSGPRMAGPMAVSLKGGDGDLPLEGGGVVCLAVFRDQDQQVHRCTLSVQQSQRRAAVRIASADLGQRLRIGGMVVEGSVKRDPESLKVSFDLVDTGPLVTVIYEGILPDLFREGQGIVAQGVLQDATTIKASEVLAKHDEEYMPPEVAEALKGIRHVPPSQQQPASGSY